MQTPLVILIAIMNELPLYWTKPNLTHCECQLLSDEYVEHEGQPYRRILLDMDPFFPGGGGQIPDEGWVNHREAWPDEQTPRQIWVKGEAPLEASDSTVHWEVNATRRWKSRQRHTAQHMLSAALAKENRTTRSVGMENDVFSIETEGDDVTEELASRLILVFQQWVREQHPIKASKLPPHQVGELRRPLSQKSLKNNHVRIIDIQGIDRVGCGGIHLNHTGEAGVLLFLGTEKIRGRCRSRWMVGMAAEERCQTLNNQSRAIGTLLSQPPENLLNRIQELLEERKKLNFAAKESSRLAGRLQASLLLSSLHTQPIASIQGGIMALDSAMEQLLHSQLPLIILLGEQDAHGFLPWVMHCQDSGVYQDFRQNWLLLNQGVGGGKPPRYQGRIRGEPVKLLQKLQDWWKRYSDVPSSPLF